MRIGANCYFEIKGRYLYTLKLGKMSGAHNDCFVKMSAKKLCNFVSFRAAGSVAGLDLIRPGLLSLLMATWAADTRRLQVLMRGPLWAGDIVEIRSSDEVLEDQLTIKKFRYNFPFLVIERWTNRRLDRPVLSVRQALEFNDPLVASHRSRVPSQTSSQFLKLRQQVDELLGVMRNNVIVWKTKGTRIKSLQGRMDRLSKISRAFKLRAKGFHNAIWWKDNRMKTIVQLEIGILFAIISVTLATHTSGSNGLALKTAASSLYGTTTHQGSLEEKPREAVHSHSPGKDKLQEIQGDQNISQEKFKDVQEKYLCGETNMRDSERLHCL
ncbi:hypothetical protein RRG08_050414 [Elysia crispata]|uniref:V-SNARE coiled-coil homology domain-containing protein n=1 Tax=Elysia crispata TaxID=231223 RepID=A0AAE0ZLB7_9GAST|nr:hypothetical protein RRG08_050414 [Elysia crispata]